MSWKNTLEPILARVPLVSQPKRHIPVKKKLMWTIGVLVVYFVLTNISLYGLDPGGGTDLFGQFRSILAGEMGTLMQVGIGPIVTGSIVMQLLTGADLLGLETDDNPRDQMLYQGLQKALIIVVTAFTAAPLVFAGGFLPANRALASSLGISVFGVQLLIFLQVFIGGLLILYLDEVVSKWGIGSGVGLFIIAGVSQRFIGGLISVPSIGETIGLIPRWILIGMGEIQLESPFTRQGFIDLMFGQGEILAIFTTVFIFAVVVYAESVRVQIPLQHQNINAGRGSYPIKLIYASVLPMILVRAVQMNIQFIGQALNSSLGLPAWFGEYSGEQPTGGLMYYLNPIQQPQEWMWWLGTTAQEPLDILVRVGIDLTIMVVGGAIFAVFWVETTDMGPEAVAKKIQRTPLQVPGFRSNTQSYERLLQRYIPQVTVVGGALVGFLAVMANLLGTIGNVDGIGLLLTISITYKIYEELAEEWTKEQIPAALRGLY